MKHKASIEVFQDPKLKNELFQFLTFPVLFIYKFIQSGFLIISTSIDIIWTNL